MKQRTLKLGNETAGLEGNLTTEGARAAPGVGRFRENLWKRSAVESSATLRLGLSRKVIAPGSRATHISPGIRDGKITGDDLCVARLLSRDR